MNILYLPKTHAFIESLDVPLDARVNKMLDLLESRGHELRMPLSKPIVEYALQMRNAFIASS